MSQYHFRSGTGDIYVAKRVYDNIWTMGPDGDETRAVMVRLTESSDPNKGTRRGVEWQQPKPLPTKLQTTTFIGSRDREYAWSDSFEWSLALAIAQRFELDAVYPLTAEEPTT